MPFCLVCLRYWASMKLSLHTRAYTLSQPSFPYRWFFLERLLNRQGPPEQSLAKRSEMQLQFWILKSLDWTLQISSVLLLALLSCLAIPKNFFFFYSWNCLACPCSDYWPQKHGHVVILVNKAYRQPIRFVFLFRGEQVNARTTFQLKVFFSYVISPKKYLRCMLNRLEQSLLHCRLNLYFSIFS